MNTRINKSVIGFGASALLASAGMATPAGTGFTYQGSLSGGGGPANGLYDLRFGLHAAAAGGSAMTWVDVDDVQVVDGLFNVKIDFGVGWLNGSAKWIEVAVRPGVSTGAY